MPHPIKRWSILSLSSLLLLLLIAPVHAQSPCSHVQFRIDSGMPVDQQAVCDAAEPWAEEGIELFVYLTDDTPTSEEEWFAQLDQIEAEAGIRDLASGGFDLNTVAFEASTTQPADWATTVTIGEELFGTSLDNDSNLEAVGSEIQAGIQNGDATAGFVDALSLSYAIAYPAPNTTLITLGVILVGIGGLLFVGILLYRPVIKPWLDERKRKQKLQVHLGVIQQNVANLLLATERVLTGERVEDAVLYQLFQAYGGDRYREMNDEVREWIRRSRAALSDAFDLRRTLQSDDVVRTKSLEERVVGWEKIYLTLVGSSPRIRNLTEAELQDLVNPMVIMERHAKDVQLAEQLDDIRRELEGMPLKIDLELVDPESVDQEGILGYVDQVEQQIQMLMAAQEAAPGRVADARKDRLAAEEAADEARPFGLTGSQTTAEITNQIQAAQTALDDRLYLTVMQLSDEIERNLNIVADLLDTDVEHQERLALVEAISAEGYRPAHLPNDLQETETDIAEIRRAITAGDYLDADTWIDELDADSQRALEHAQGWRERHLFNNDSLTQIQQRLVQVQTLLDGDAQQAWQGLVAYPAVNWEDLTTHIDRQRDTLNELTSAEIPRITTLNSLDVQDIPAAELALAEAGKRLLSTERTLQGMVHRLAELHTAEQTLPDGLQQGQADLAKATAFRDAEDRKIGAEVDQVLDQASAALEEARSQHAARALIQAVARLADARKLASDAYADASQQVAHINALETELEQLRNSAEQQIRRTQAQAEQTPPQAATVEANSLLQTMATQLTTARQALAQALTLEDHALAEALATAVAAYLAAQQAGLSAETRIKEDFKAYSQLRRQTKDAIEQAERAIGTAAARVDHRDAKGEGRAALGRARNVLPSQRQLADASREELQSIRADADRAASYAQEAYQKAQNRINQEQMRRAAVWGSAASRSRNRRGSSGGGWSWGGSSMPRNSNRSSRSSFGSSRRSSFGGSSRRSSFGGSRRSSSGGSRRR